MELVSIILSIAASIVSIVAAVMSVQNAKEINKIKGSITSGDDSVNTIGSGNSVRNGKR
jgi:hypothetical protein